MSSLRKPKWAKEADLSSMKERSQALITQVKEKAETPSNHCAR